MQKSLKSRKPERGTKNRSSEEKEPVILTDGYSELDASDTFLESSFFIYFAVNDSGGRDPTLWSRLKYLNSLTMRLIPKTFW